MGSGCYGINGADTVTYDAALLSQAVGRPVRVQLSRKDEMAWENFGVPFVIDQRVALDAKGAIVAWDYESWSATLGGRPGSQSDGAGQCRDRLPGRLPAAVHASVACTRPDRRLRERQQPAPSYVVGCIGGSAAGPAR